MTTLSENQIAQARALRKDGRSFRQIAARLGVAHGTIQRALRNPSATEVNTIEKLRLERLTKLRH